MELKNDLFGRLTPDKNSFGPLAVVKELRKELHSTFLHLRCYRDNQIDLSDICILLEQMNRSPNLNLQRLIEDFYQYLNLSTLLKIQHQLKMR